MKNKNINHQCMGDSDSANKSLCEVKAPEHPQYKYTQRWLLRHADVNVNCYIHVYHTCCCTSLRVMHGDDTTRNRGPFRNY